MQGREIARVGLALVAWLFVGCLFVQIFLAGLGVFDSPSSFATHREFGYLFGWLTLVMLVLAIIGRVSRRLLGLTALSLVLFAMQSVLIVARADYPAVAALHPVNGVLLIVVAITIARWAWAERVVARGSASPEQALAADGGTRS
jgi:mercuric ion transport protein